MTSSLFKPIFFQEKHARYRRDDDFLLAMIAQEVEEKLKDHARVFEKIAIISPSHLNWPFEGDIYEPSANLGLPTGAYDLVLHLHSLHAHNDVVGQLIQARMALKPDGVFIGAFLGGQTLTELGKTMVQAEIEAHNGASQRVAPMIDIKDAGALLSRAGFALPVADNWSMNAEYKDVPHLINDLRRLGISNPLAAKAPRLSARFYRRLDELYRENYTCATGLISASFEFIFLTGYAPSETQPKPLRPGSVTTSLFEAIENTKTEKPKS